MFSAAGCFGRPGIVRMLPVSATMKPAPALMRSSLTVMRKPVGRPIFVASSDSEYCVLAMQTGILSKPSPSISLSCFLAAGVKSTPSPP